jgi:hypothetical protein
MSKHVSNKIWHDENARKTYIVWLFTSIFASKIGVVAVSVRVTVLEPSKS